MYLKNEHEIKEKHSAVCQENILNNLGIYQAVWWRSVYLSTLCGDDRRMTFLVSGQIIIQSTSNMKI